MAMLQTWQARLAVLVGLMQGLQLLSGFATGPFASFFWWHPIQVSMALGLVGCLLFLWPWKKLHHGQGPGSVTRELVLPNRIRFTGAAGCVLLAAFAIGRVLFLWQPGPPAGGNGHRATPFDPVTGSVVRVPVLTAASAVPGLRVTVTYVQDSSSLSLQTAQASTEEGRTQLHLAPSEVISAHLLRNVTYDSGSAAEVIRWLSGLLAAKNPKLLGLLGSGERSLMNLTKGHWADLRPVLPPSSDWDKMSEPDRLAMKSFCFDYVGVFRPVFKIELDNFGAAVEAHILRVQAVTREIRSSQGGPDLKRQLEVDNQLNLSPKAGDSSARFEPREALKVPPGGIAALTLRVGLPAKAAVPRAPIVVFDLDVVYETPDRVQHVARGPRIQLDTLFP